MLIAQPAQAEAIRGPLADLQHLRLEVFATVDEALEAIRVRGPRVILADFERFGAAGIHGLAELMGTCNVPVILFVRDVSQWEREQFAVLGVQHVFGEHFRVSELAAQVEYAIKRRRRIGSSDRLPVVTA